MSRAFNVRTEVASIIKGFRDYHSTDTENLVVAWYRFDTVDTTVHSIYDEGSATGGRRWRKPIYVPILYFDRIEGEQRRDDQGLYIVDSFTLTASKDAMRKAGVDVESPQSVLNDRFVFDGRVYAIDKFHTEGRLGHYEVVVGVRGILVKADELVNDVDFQSFLSEDVPDSQ